MIDSNMSANKEISQLSVVVATYDRPAETIDLLKSVRESVAFFENVSDADIDVEMLVCTKHDEEETIAAVKQFGWGAVRILATEKRHASHNRDVGFQNANGEYILSTDSDCLVERDWIDMVVRSIKEHDYPSAIQGANYLDYPPESNWVTQFECRDDRERFKFESADGRNLIIRSDVYRQIGGYDTEHLDSIWAEDNFFAERVRDHGGEFVMDARIRVQHRYSPTVLGNLKRYNRYGRGAVHVYRYDPTLYREISAPLKQWYWWLASAIETFKRKPSREAIRDTTYHFARTVAYTIGFLQGVIFFLREELGLIDPTKA